MPASAARLPKSRRRPAQRHARRTGRGSRRSTGGEAVPAAKFAGDPLKAAWLPNEAIAKAWMRVRQGHQVARTPHRRPHRRRCGVQGNQLTWEAEADLESGMAGFVIERDGKLLAERAGAGPEPLRPPGLPKHPVQRYAHAAAGADALHRSKAEWPGTAHLPGLRREHRGAEVGRVRKPPDKGWNRPRPASWASRTHPHGPGHRLRSG